MDEIKKNIQVRSNVYPVKEDVFSDIQLIARQGFPSGKIGSTHKFLSQIRGKSALKKLAQYVHGDMAHEEMYQTVFENLGIKEWQIRLYWDLDTPCAYAESGHNPHGLISEKNIGCKCQNHTCRFFDKNTEQCGC